MYTLSWNILEIKWHELTLEGSHGEWQRLLDANGDGIIDANNPSEFSFYHHGKAKSIFCVDGGWWSPEIEYLEMNAIHIQKYLENAGKTVPIYIYMYVCIYIYISPIWDSWFVSVMSHEGMVNIFEPEDQRCWWLKYCNQLWHPCIFTEKSPIFRCSGCNVMFNHLVPLHYHQRVLKHHQFSVPVLPIVMEICPCLLVILLMEEILHHLGWLKPYK